MVLARKESVYVHEQVEEKQQHKPKRNKKPKQDYRFEKIIVTTSLAIIFVFSILLLTRFMSITEVKHTVNKLQNRVEDLEIEREKLRVEVEKVSKSRWIEEEAKSRLNMVYPSSDQMIYININPTKVASINNELRSVNNDSFDQEVEMGVFNSFFSKLFSYISI